MLSYCRPQYRDGNKKGCEMISSLAIPQLNNHTLTKIYFFSTIPISKPSLNFIPFIDSLDKNRSNAFRLSTRDSYLLQDFFTYDPFCSMPVISCACV